MHALVASVSSHHSPKSLLGYPPYYYLHSNSRGSNLVCTSLFWTAMFLVSVLSFTDAQQESILSKEATE